MTVREWFRVQRSVDWFRRPMACEVWVRHEWPTPFYQALAWQSYFDLVVGLDGVCGHPVSDAETVIHLRQMMNDARWGFDPGKLENIIQ